MADSQTATILVTDLVGSTELRVRLGEERANELRRTHDSLLLAAVEANGGTVIKGLGDGILALFTVAADAVAASIAMQQAVYAHARNVPDEPLDLRVGLSSGDVSLEGGDCFGTPVIEASRICAAATSGQILAADLVRLLARGRGGYVFTAAGERQLKGLPEPVPVVVVGWEPPAPEEAGIPFPSGLVPQGALPFSGRSEQTEFLLQAWKEASGGDRKVVLVSGEPGIGKTRLAAEVARSLYDQGGIVLFGRCDEDLGLGFQPFVEALEQVVRTRPGAESLGRYGGDLVRLVPDLSDRVPGLSTPIQADPETERYRLLDAVAAWLSALGEERGVLLVLDDLHWAEKPTLLLLRHLIRSPEHLRLLIFATYRDTDLDRTHPLGEILPDLHREPGVQRIALSGLDVAGVAELISNAAGERLDARAKDLAQPLWSETEGNPFFVQEIILSLVESGRVVQRDGVWTTDLDFEELGIPEGVRQAVGRRLSRLSDDANAVLSVASVIGPSVDVDVLVDVSELDLDTVIDALDEARAAALVQERTSGTYEFTHALVRSTLYDELSATRRSVRHRQVAEALERRPGADPATLLYHFRRAGTVDLRATEYAEAAGRAALAQLAFDQAVTFLTQAVEAADAVDTDARHRCMLLVRLGDAQRLAGIAAHRGTLLAAAHLAQELGDPGLLAEAALANNRGYTSMVGTFDEERITALWSALDAAGDDDSPVRARLLVTLASELMLGRPSPELADEAVEIARRLGDERCLLEVSRARQYAAWVPSRIVELLAEIPDLLELAERVGDAQELVWVCLWGCLHYTEMADVKQAAALLGRAAEVATETNNPLFRWLVAGFQIMLTLISGSGDDVETAALEAFRLGTESEQPDTMFWLTTQLLWARELQGRLGEVIDPLREVVAASTSVPAAMRAVLAMTLARCGQIKESRELIDELLSDIADPIPFDASWLMAHTNLAIAIHAVGSENQACQEYERLLPFAGRLTAVAMAIGFSVNFALALLAVRAGWPEQAERHFEDAEAQDEYLSAPVRLARTKLEWGRFLRGQGQVKRSRELLVQARQGAKRMGASDIVAEAIELLSA